jgi:hypothetical protein
MSKANHLECGREATAFIPARGVPSSIEGFGLKGLAGLKTAK